MYLSDRDLGFVLTTGQLIVDPPPAEMDTTAIDLHLDSIEAAKVWDVAAYEQAQRDAGHDPVTLGVGTFNYKAFAPRYTIPIPPKAASGSQKVYRDGNRVIVEPHGFFLWQTKEVVGTPETDPRLICFIDGKSTRARTGLLVHMTAPTIHAGWWGKVTLEIGNLGPFRLALKEGDAVAQIVVAAISSPPLQKKAAKGIDVGQLGVTGRMTPAGG